MGLDLIPVPKARPGHETEWFGLAEPLLRGKALSDEEMERFRTVSILPEETLGAPVVGRDRQADAWLHAFRGATAPEEQRRLVEEFSGRPVYELVDCDGVPPYSNGDVSDRVDRASFRGDLLDLCVDVIDMKTAERAWKSKLPEHVLDYGRVLAEAAETAAERGPLYRPPEKPRGFLAALFARPAPPPMPFDEQLRIVRAASRWFLYWGERGHPVQAWF